MTNIASFISIQGSLFEYMGKFITYSLIYLNETFGEKLFLIEKMNFLFGFPITINWLTAVEIN